MGVVPRLKPGTSDPVSYCCTCSAGEEGGGAVLLFYRYYGNFPVLPLPSHEQVQEIAAWQKSLTAALAINGKIRIAEEGFNVTVAGTKSAIHSYIEACSSHWSFAGLPLSTAAEQQAFFKPSPGCACVFHPAAVAAVRICSEITPLGITNFVPLSWDLVEDLTPAEFHRRCHEEDFSLMDLRNHYESNIGHFIDPRTNTAAMRPQIRRFSQWPRYIKMRAHEIDVAPQLLTYCTGGIRCEKASRWLAQRNKQQKICTLRGGIAAYLDWMKCEIAAGHKTPADSLFRGKNYVFDARGSIGLDVALMPISECHTCGKPEDRLGKCSSPSCHLVLVICPDCQGSGVYCCENCKVKDPSSKVLCMCESDREAALWRPDSKQGENSA